jgi:CubicO group peptidase (beta-lactamase class C family)
MISRTILFTLLPFLAAASPRVNADNTPYPEGVADDGLPALNSAMHKWVDDKNGANAVTIFSRHGKIINFDAYGAMDPTDPKVPVKKDTIFRIASMTKPITGLAMMMFYEEGKWKLDDPVSKHIPEFANIKVKADNGQISDLKKPVTMAMIMSHSAGFGRGARSSSPTLDGIIPSLVQGGLSFQPGSKWVYGPSVDIQGYLIQKWAGKDLSDFLEERVFKPLGMVDTGFFIDKSKASRLSKMHNISGGRITSNPVNATTSKPVRLSPSGGLMSTAEDYWKFAQMILNGGEFNGKRYLKPETVKIMHQNVLEPDVFVSIGGGNGGLGFGMDFAIVLDQEKAKTNMPKGCYFWDGAFGTWFWIDPTNNITMVGMIQQSPALLQGVNSPRQVSAKAIYSSLKK